MLMDGSAHEAEKVWDGESEIWMLYLESCHTTRKLDCAKTTSHSLQVFRETMRDADLHAFSTAFQLEYDILDLKNNRVFL